MSNDEKWYIDMVQNQNIRYNQVSTARNNYEKPGVSEPDFLGVLEELHRLYPHFNFNTSD